MLRMEMAGVKKTLASKVRREFLCVSQNNLIWSFEVKQNRSLGLNKHDAYLMTLEVDFVPSV